MVPTSQPSAVLADAVPREGEQVVVSLAGMRSIRDSVRLPLARLNLLCGRNGSGKSTVVDSLLLLKQTAQAWRSTEALARRGPFVASAELDRLASAGSGGVISFGFGINLDVARLAVCRQLSVGTGSPASLLRVEYHDGGQVLSLQPGELPPREALAGRFARIATQFEPRERCRVVPDRFLLESQIVEQDSAGAETVVARWSPHYVDAIHSGFLGAIRAVTLKRVAQSSWQDLDGSWELDALPFESVVVSALRGWQADDDERFERVRAVMSDLCHAPRIRVEDDGQRGRILVASRGGGTGRVEDVPLEQAAAGTRHALPVVAAVVSARGRGDQTVVYLEEPEATLHAAAQARMGWFLAETSAEDGAPIIVAETHSPILLRAVQVAVSSGVVPPGAVRFHWFSRDEDGATRVRSVQPDDHGRWGDSGEDINPVAYDLDMAWFHRQRWAPGAGG